MYFRTKRSPISLNFQAKIIYLEYDSHISNTCIGSVWKQKNPRIIIHECLNKIETKRVNKTYFNAI